MVDNILNELVKFHGHLCPGLMIGYKAALLSQKFGFIKSDDEEIIAIVENNSCSVDAIQYMLSCTFGKGNLFFKDYGKQVFTIIKRHSLNAIRISLKPEARKENPNREEFLNFLLNNEAEKIFHYKIFNFSQSELPEKAVIRKSVICDNCQEPTMENRIMKYKNNNYCIPCFNKEKTQKNNNVF